MKDKEGFYLGLTAVIATLSILLFSLWLCWMGERHPELTQQSCKWNSNDGPTYCCFISTISPKENPHISQDKAGTWRLNTFKGDPQFPYLIVVACQNPFKGEYIELSPAGEADCNVNREILYKSRERLRDMLETVLYLTERKYVVSICLSVCHSDWFVIYLHDRKEYAEKEVYEKLWKHLK